MNALKAERGSVTRLLIAVAVGLSLAGCGDQTEQGTAPEILLERATAFRMACASAVLEQTAAEDLELLEATAQFYQQADTVSGASAPTTNAAVAYARGYLQHAELRAAGYAMLDSAVNHATSPEDSLRFAERAMRYGIRAPEEGTVERNVLESYQANLGAILGDDDHRCNWDIPGMDDPS